MKYNLVKSIKISLCYTEVLKNPQNAEDLFYKNLISKEDFFKDPWKVLNNSNLLTLYNQRLFTYKTAVPLLFSLLMYGEEIPEKVLNDLNSSKGVFSFLSSSKNSSNLSNIKFDQNISNNTRNVAVADTDDNLTKTNLKIRNNIKKKESIPKTRSNAPNTDQLKMLNLQTGRNEIKFVCRSRLSGVQTLVCDAYLWNYNDKIVISDVDGTITRSDVLGQIMPILGKDWAHEGVTDLFTNIANNGYKILYLTARALCQSSTTKNYIQNLFQNQKSLPPGPILMSPDGLVSSFKREVIDKTPETFKIACLTEVKSLFPKNSHPLLSGFGNRITVINNIIFFYSLKISN